LDKLSGLVCPKELEGVHHVYHQYTIRTENRDALRAELAEKGIATAVYYPVTLPAQEAFEDHGYDSKAFPNSDQASKEVLSLPMFPELKEDEVDRVVEAIESRFHRVRKT
jgi:dTDP-4-amino-4,6-dideoxygalactose transaminase